MFCRTSNSIIFYELEPKLLYSDFLQTTKFPKIPISHDLTGTIRERVTNEDAAAEKYDMSMI